MFDLQDKIALVTGASGGIGAQIATALHAQGATVVLHGTRASKLEALKAELGARAATVTANLENRDAVAGLFESASDAAGGPINILVNNAGGPPPGDFRDWTRETWIEAFDANMLAAFDLIKAVVDPMIDRRFGRIVNITSGSVKSPIPILGLSNGARAALTGFCAGLARQVAQHNVTVNGLLPGQFNTDRIESLINNTAKNEGRSPEDVRATFEARNPAKRLGEIEEFGFACAWMCSAHSGYLTGQNILIDGGSFNSTL